MKRFQVLAFVIGGPANLAFSYLGAASHSGSIINALGELPVKACLGSTMTFQGQVMRVDLARELP